MSDLGWRPFQSPLTDRREEREEFVRKVLTQHLRLNLVAKVHDFPPDASVDRVKQCLRPVPCQAVRRVSLAWGVGRITSPKKFNRGAAAESFLVLRNSQLRQRNPYKFELSQKLG